MNASSLSNLIKQNREKFIQPQIASKNEKVNDNIVSTMPKKYVDKDSEFEEMMYLLANDPQLKDIVKNKMNEGIIGKPAFDPRVFEVAKKKEAEIELANFENWIGESMALKNPIEIEYLKGMYPEYFSGRAELMLQRLEIFKFYMFYMIYGPRSKEDLVLLYQIKKDANLFNGFVDIFEKFTELSVRDPLNTDVNSMMGTYRKRINGYSDGMISYKTPGVTFDNISSFTAKDGVDPNGTVKNFKDTKYPTMDWVNNKAVLADSNKY